MFIQTRSHPDVHVMTEMRTTHNCRHLKFRRSTTPVPSRSQRTCRHVSESASLRGEKYRKIALVPKSVTIQDKQF
jgi:hypothetical protein